VRTLIEDAFLLRVLETIEDARGQKIRTKHFLPGEYNFPTFTMGCDRTEEYFCFKYAPEFMPTQINICHELLHAYLWLAGWHLSYIDPPHWRKTHPGVWDVLFVFKALPQHIVMWDLMERLGYSEEPEYAEVAVRDVMPLVASGALLDCPHPDFYLGVQAIALAHVLLSPIPKTLRKDILGAARRTMPQECRAAKRILRIFAQASPLSPESALDAINQTLRLTGFPQGILKFYQLKKICPQFRDCILDVRRDHL
jgi:hypothetical protein